MKLNNYSIDFFNTKLINAYLDFLEEKQPYLEKILVDIQKDADYSYLQGAESDNMLSNAESLYMINYSRMYRYGRRRGLNLKQK